jgi:hypothetical protein
VSSAKQDNTIIHQASLAMLEVFGQEAYSTINHNTSPTNPDLTHQEMYWLWASCLNTLSTRDDVSTKALSNDAGKSPVPTPNNRALNPLDLSI